jgi:hypothetical protein
VLGFLGVAGKSEMLDNHVVVGGAQV